VFTNSFTLILLSIVIGLPPLFILFWAIWKGHFDDTDTTADSIFEEDELRYARPWENHQQVEARIEQHGTLTSNPFAEWERWL
jgi:cbb3-type cytochrome oxidase maturation protein